MSDGTKTEQSPFLTELDGEILIMPGRSLESMLGMFSHLESLALRRCRKSGVALPPLKDIAGVPQLLPKADALAKQRISYREFGRQVIRAAQNHVRLLKARVEEMQSLVLINQWPAAERLWQDFLPECKTPLYELNFLEELWGINSDRFGVDGLTLTKHWQQFVLIQAEVEVLLARRHSLVKLSDALEGQLGAWLKRFEEILEKLDEKSIA